MIIAQITQLFVNIKIVRIMQQIVCKKMVLTKEELILTIFCDEHEEYFIKRNRNIGILVAVFVTIVVIGIIVAIIVTQVH